MKFEYHLTPLPVELTVTTILNHLNKLGSDDWELVTIFNGVAYFKRESNQDIREAQKRYYTTLLEWVKTTWYRK